jgi:hypothetical protein
MLKRTSIISVFSAFLISFYGCQDQMIPSGYLHGPLQVEKSFTGSWIEISTNADSVPDSKIELSGELIAIQSDTVYILTQLALVPLHRNRINSATLFVFTNQSPVPPLLGGLSYVPNILGALIYPEYSNAFLFLGVPVLTTGIILGLVERGGNSSLKYPKKYKIDDFKKFARFPQGLPVSVQRRKLHLITMVKI